jgi:acyl carrier protein
MPRGSRPGERRGGRQRGTPNKNTLLKNAVFCAAAAEPNRSPLDFMLALMRDPQVPLDLRLDMAAAAAPFVHARPRPRSQNRPHPMELRARAAKAAVQSGGGDGTSGGKETPALQPALPEADEKPTLQPAFAGTDENSAPQPALPGGPGKAEPGGGERVVRLTAVGPEATRPCGLRPLSPLEFLMAVMSDAEAAPRQRMRAAQVAARYKHRTADAQAPAEPVEDEFGFRIDPQVAKTIREVVQQSDYLADLSEPSPADVQKHRGLLKHLHEQIATVGCSEVYGWADVGNDRTRLKGIRELKTRQHKLPAEVDAEEAYLITRGEVFRASVAARYKHRPADCERSAELVEDEFGFRIDPQVARTIREVVQECDYLADLGDPSPAEVRKHGGLLKCLHEQTATVGCSEVYGWANLKNDETRVKKIRELKTRRHKLPPEVDAEEAYLITRVEVFRASPTHQAWCRVSALEVSRARGNTLTDAEISELASLRAGCPTIAQQFANRDWSQYVWDSRVSSFVDRIEEQRRLNQRGATPEEIEKHGRQREASILEAQERAEISRRRMDYLNERVESSKNFNPRLERILRITEKLRAADDPKMRKS